jgi:hypothetical protein
MKLLAIPMMVGALLLGGCAGFDGRGLTPGQSTSNEVDALMGPAADKRVRPGGETWLYYPRQPYGLTNYVARIGQDGKLIAVEQRLTDENVARIERGKSTAESVRELLGPPYKVWNFPRMEREILEYRMRSLSSTVPYGLYVQFSPDGIAREVFMESDPDARLSESGSGGPQ